MTYIIPNLKTKTLKQTNINDISGSIFATKNIDLREKGYIKLSHPAVAIFTTEDDADFSIPDVIFKSDNLWTISLDPFVSNIGNPFERLTNRKTDTNAPATDIDEDGIYFNSKDVISEGTAIKYRSATTVWTTVSLSLSATHPTRFEVFDKFACLLVGNNNTIKMIDTTWVQFRELVLPVQYQITSITVNDGVAYIGTRHKTNGEAKLFLWDGESAAYNNEYGVNTFEISSVKKYGGSCVLVTSIGHLLQFNGGGFTELARFPLQDRNWGDAATPQLKVSNHGIITEEKKIYIKIDSTNSSYIKKFNPYFSSGLWCFEPETGLYCLATNSYNRVSYQVLSTANVNTTTNVITVSAAPVTGTPMFYDSMNSTILAGLANNTIYYVIKVSGTTIKLASSLANALAGTEIDLTGTGHDNQKLYFILVKDYGHSLTDSRGAVEIVPNSLISKDYYIDKIVFTGRMYAPGYGVMNVLSPLVPNRGYFITPKLASTVDEDNYNSITVKYKPLKIGDSIVIKYRTSDKTNLPFDGFKDTTYASPIYANWNSTTQFRTTLDMSNASVGDEIEILAGVGAGFLAHITEKTVNAGTWTITIDEPFIYALVNELFYFSVDNFSKLKEITISNQTGTDITKIAINKNSKFSQFKVELRGVDVTIEEFKVNNQNFKG